MWWSPLAAVLVALVAWGAGETKSLQFAPTVTDVSMMGHAYRDVSPETRREAELKTLLVRTGLFAGLMGLGAGLVGGTARRSARTAILGATTGLILGILLVVAIVPPLMKVYLRAEDAGPGELTRAVLMHLGLWLPLGAAAGVGLAVGLGWPRRIPAAVVGGLAGTALATLGYEVMGSVLFPLAETHKPIALEWQPRLLATVFLALGASLGAAAAVGMSGRNVVSRTS